MTVEPRQLRWAGKHVVWYMDGSWEFHSCVRCGEELRSQRAKESGYGSGCIQYEEPTLRARILREERALARHATQPVSPLMNARARRTAARAGAKIPANQSPPSPKQLSYLRSLAMHAGESFIRPNNRQIAISEIQRLKMRVEALSHGRGSASS